MANVLIRSLFAISHSFMLKAIFRVFRIGNTSFVYLEHSIVGLKSTVKRECSKEKSSDRWSVNSIRWNNALWTSQIKTQMCPIGKKLLFLQQNVARFNVIFLGRQSIFWWARANPLKKKVSGTGFLNSRTSQGLPWPNLKCRIFVLVRYKMKMFKLQSKFGNTVAKL